MALTKEQRLQRRFGLGGSDMAAVMGLSKYKTPLQVYFDKVMDDLPEEIESPYALWGNLLEPVIIKRFEDVTGFKCESIDTKKHPKYPFMIGNIDAFIPCQNAILECKTASQYMAKEWSKEGGDALPEPYIIQGAHYAAIYNVNRVYFALLLGGNDFRIYHYDRNMEIEKAIINAASKFWNEHVIPQIPPPPTTKEDSLRLWSHICNGTAVESDEMIKKTVEELIELKAELKMKIDSIQDQINKKTMVIHQYMKDAEILNDVYGNTLATWKNQSISRFDLKSFKEENPDIHAKYMRETTNRVFKLKEIKS